MTALECTTLLAFSHDRAGNYQRLAMRYSTLSRELIAVLSSIAGYRGGVADLPDMFLLLRLVQQYEMHAMLCRSYNSTFSCSFRLRP